MIYIFVLLLAATFFFRDQTRVEHAHGSYAVGEKAQGILSRTRRSSKVMKFGK
jgi:hypothetical protein